MSIVLKFHILWIDYSIEMNRLTGFWLILDIKSEYLHAAMYPKENQNRCKEIWINSIVWFLSKTE
jgi:hypothetical protein